MRRRYGEQSVANATPEQAESIRNDIHWFIDQWTNGLFRGGKLSAARKGREGFEKMDDLTSIAVGSKAKSVMIRLLYDTLKLDSETIRVSAFQVVTLVLDICAFYDIDRSRIAVGLMESCKIAFMISFGLIFYFFPNSVALKYFF